LSTGSCTPITPVERTSTCAGSSPSAAAASACVARAAASPCSPVAAFAIPELTTTACGSATASASCDTSTGAAFRRLAVNIAAPTAGAIDRTSARSGDERRMPAATAAASNPCAAVTLKRGLP
jgi:hypothetical protein